MNDRDHPTALELQALADGELTGPAADRWREHGRVCDRCRRELDGIRRVQAALAAGRGDEAPGPVWPRLAAARSRRRTLPMGPALAAGALAACAAGVALGLALGEAPPRAPSPDGTLLWAAPTETSILDVIGIVSGDRDGEDAS